MLQMSAQPLQRQLHQSHASPQHANQTSQREYHLLLHHKAGTGFCLEASSHVSNLSRHVDGLPELFVPQGTMEFGVNSSMMRTPKPACFANIVRNPFDLVVSLYMYNLAAPADEDYLRKAFGRAVEEDIDGCEPLFKDGRMNDWCKDSPQKYGTALFHRSIAQVFLGSVSGPVADHLPDASANESFPEYLQRVDVDAGLIASSVFASDVVLKPMRFAKDNMKMQSCSTDVCFSELYDNCKNMWQRVFQAWNISEPQYSSLVSAAAKACPDQSRYAQLHSSKATAERRNISHPPLHEMVKRLRKLDRLHLNGTISALEEHLGCPSSGKYRESA